MQQKASVYVGGEQRGAGNEGSRHENRVPKNTDTRNNRNDKQDRNGREEHDEAQQDKNDSTFILLILLILLSQGETDDKLLLALLYLLF